MRPERNPLIRWFASWKRDYTDDELVAQTRKHIAFAERWRWWVIVGYVVIGIVYFEFLSPMVFGLLSSSLSTGTPPWQVASSFAAGVMAGAGTALPAFLMVFVAGDVFNPLRTERLLLKYHDALRELERSRAREQTPHT